MRCSRGPTERPQHDLQFPFDRADSSAAIVGKGRFAGGLGPLARTGLAATLGCRFRLLSVERSSARTTRRDPGRRAGQPSGRPRACLPGPDRDTEEPGFCAVTAAGTVRSRRAIGRAAARERFRRPDSIELGSGAGGPGTGGGRCRRHAAGAQRRTPVPSALLAVRAGCRSGDSSAPVGVCRVAGHHSPRAAAQDAIAAVSPNRRIRCARLAEDRLRAGGGQPLRRDHRRARHRQDDDRRETAGAAANPGTGHTGRFEAGTRLADPAGGTDRQGGGSTERVHRRCGFRSSVDRDRAGRGRSRRDSVAGDHAPSAAGRPPGHPQVPPPCRQSAGPGCPGDRRGLDGRPGNDGFRSGRAAEHRPVDPVGRQGSVGIGGSRGGAGRIVSPGTGRAFHPVDFRLAARRRRRGRTVRADRRWRHGP